MECSFRVLKRKGKTIRTISANYFASFISPTLMIRVMKFGSSLNCLSLKSRQAEPYGFKIGCGAKIFQYTRPRPDPKTKTQ